MKKLIVLLMAGLLAGGAVVKAADNPHRLGVGATYWTALDTIDVNDVKDNGFSYLLSYQYRPTLLGIELDAEMLPDLFGKDAYAPAAYLILGKAIYAAAGVGIVNRDGKWADDPFYAIKAGLDLELLPSLYLDISATYRFDSKVDIGDAVDQIDTDTIYLGAAVRLGF